MAWGFRSNVLVGLLCHLLAGLGSFVQGETQPPDIYWYAPKDGGTPRNPDRIIRTGDGEYLIYAAPLMSSLTHAVSRVDLVCRNESPFPKELTVRFDLSGDGNRRNFDQNVYGEMPLRDYIYIRPPGGLWQRVNGTTEGWTSSIKFTAPPGETLVGLSPWYTYRDFLAYIAVLPDHEHLRKRRVGRSDGGREHWEITITDSAVPEDQKERIIWFARKHAYETFSSFAVEGLVDYLLSEDADARLARRRYIFKIHPMVNVDGVAQGYEYRGGYDFPEVRATASSRLVFSTLDSFRPHYLVDWHNWIAPRGEDRLWYTYEEDGKPSRRAWDVFTQRYPSPRCVGHRWQDEQSPLQRNVLVRNPVLSDDRPGQRALKRYGTRNWGWEMPWWGRDEGNPAQNARVEGERFVKVLLQTLELLRKPAPSNYRERLQHTVRLGQAFESVVQGIVHVEDPRCAAVIGEFTSPSAEIYEVEGKHQAPDRWSIRFSPTEPGVWRYLIRGEGVEVFQQGEILVGSQ
jgi:hypothetical protein